MTEDQIERAVERRMDALDRHLMSGELSQAKYDLAVCELDEWAEEQYRQCRMVKMEPERSEAVLQALSGEGWRE